MPLITLEAETVECPPDKGWRCHQPTGRLRWRVLGIPMPWNFLVRA